MSLLTNVLKLWRTGQYLLPADSGFMVKHLFANGEPGFAKLDFSGFAGMYQDRARTIPYTAVEQPLGSFTGLNGVTATAPADVNRGVVSARVNLYSSTENLSSVWTLTAATVTTSGTSPTGSAAWLMSDSAVTSSHTASQYATATNARNSMRLLAKPQGGRYVYLQVGNGFDRGAAIFDLQAEAVTDSFSVGLGAVSFSISPLTDGWLLLSISAICNAGLRIFGFGICSGPLLANWVFLGDNTRKVLFAEPSLTLSTDAHLPYQWVNTATDYDTAGFPHYLKFNGTNTAYVTPSIDFTGTDKMTVWAGITKIGDATRNPIIEVAGYGVAKGFGLYSSPDTLPNQIQAFHAGATCAYVYAAGMPPGGNYRLSMVSDLASPYLNLRKDGVQVAQSLTNVGGGAYGNLPMSIGTGSSSRYFNGRLYSLIVRGAATPLPHIEVVETLIRKTMRLP